MHRIKNTLSIQNTNFSYKKKEDNLKILKRHVIRAIHISTLQVIFNRYRK